MNKYEKLLRIAKDISVNLGAEIPMKPNGLIHTGLKAAIQECEKEDKQLPEFDPIALNIHSLLDSLKNKLVSNNHYSIASDVKHIQDVFTGWQSLQKGRAERDTGTVSKWDNSVEVKTPETKSVPYQCCPVCGGSGLMGTNTYGMTFTVPPACDVCNGAKIIPQYIIPSEQ